MLRDLTGEYPLLFARRWPVRGLADAIAAIDVQSLGAEYAALRQHAPRRSLAGKAYFVGHSGTPAADRSSNRLEEHYAIALINLRRRWPLAEGGWFRLLDYQIPLKKTQADAGIGKVDLLGVTAGGRLMIIELKVETQSGGRSDPPPAALMEALRYCAMVEADFAAIAREAEARFGVMLTSEPPIAAILAPESWWRSWFDVTAAGDWGPAFADLGEKVTAQTGVSLSFMALENVTLSYGLDAQPPRLGHVPVLRPVDPADPAPIGPPLAVTARRSSKAYLNTLHAALWVWADQHHAGHLDGGRRTGRPPVLKRESAGLNVLEAPDSAIADKVRALIPAKQRHRHFGSLKSSQALAQSVFGTIAVLDRLDLLQTVTAECGRPAFFTDHRGWSLALEHEVRTLGEPRPTSIDVLLSRERQRVAIECKFTETEFGTCSRPRLRPRDNAFSSQRCDGAYHAQAGRTERCALTAIGIRYWEHLPRLFDWPADRDHAPCRFGLVYQLARNALAAVVMPDGTIDLTRGHALIVYDANNPSFDAGGEADRQWEAAMADCLVPGLLRRLSWQRLLTSLAGSPELTWLTDAARKKYALQGVAPAARRFDVELSQ